MGSPPRIFNGDRQQADVFLNKLLTYICINIGVPGFKSPLRKIALALTYIKGDKVNRWAKSVAQWWDSLDPVAHNVHYTWLHFLTAFRQQFLNHTNQQWAALKLDTLKFCFPEIDQYISEFEDLTMLTGYTIGSQESINIFMKGLTSAMDVSDKVADHPVLENYYTLKEKAVSVVKAKQLMNALKQSTGTPGRFGPPPPPLRGKGPGTSPPVYHHHISPNTTWLMHLNRWITSWCLWIYPGDELHITEEEEQTEGEEDNGTILKAMSPKPTHQPYPTPKDHVLSAANKDTLPGNVTLKPKSITPTTWTNKMTWEECNPP
jgi:hypothetical protein